MLGVLGVWAYVGGYEEGSGCSSGELLSHCTFIKIQCKMHKCMMNCINAAASVHVVERCNCHYHATCKLHGLHHAVASVTGALPACDGDRSNG